MLTKEKIDTVLEKAKKGVLEVKTLDDLKLFSNFYLGKKGEIAALLDLLKDSPQKREFGQKINLVKKEIEKVIDLKEKELEREFINKKLTKEKIDITIPGDKVEKGHLHPITIVRRKIEEIFESMGFEVVEGPEVETEWYNFDALNIPKNHPARDAWDTFWLKSGNLLRTHTSPVQIRYMEKHQPPFRIIAPGRIYRHEATDACHEFQFYQLEGLMVDENISVANFKSIIEDFLTRFFGEKVRIRLRPSFLPFTEPSFEIDMSCRVCQGKGCSACKNNGWLELMGAGMVHPNVLKNSGLNPKFFQGFAFGVGLDRLVMMKYKINDIRWFHSTDLRFLKQF